jgi:hypothetical protein
MRGTYLTIFTSLALAIGTQADAKSALPLDQVEGGGPSAAIPGVLQCVPFARDTSGIRLYGDAHTWWSQAAGKYGRGHAPQPGAVMAIQPHGNSTLGHVATVSQVLNGRTILISHANWSAPGQIERNVTAVDVSPNNDWSEVRIWYAPIRNLGGSHWPVSGFIYKSKGAKVAQPSAAAPTMTRFVPGKVAKVRFGVEPQLASKALSRMTAASTVVRPKAQAHTLTRLVKVDARRDPIGAIIARSR